MRPSGSPAELERRRLRAIELLQRDIPVHVVAERLGVDRRSVRRWSSGSNSRSSTIPITSGGCSERVGSVRSDPSRAPGSATTAACASGSDKTGPG